MQRRRCLSLLLPGAVAAAWPALGAAQTAGGSDARIVLGQSAPFSGPAAQLGVQFHLGAQMAFEAINERGGVNGRRIELRRLDDGYEPERCAANTRQLLRDDVFALFGYIGTPTSLAALPLATDAKVPFFAPFTGAQALREPFNRYAVHVRASYNDETAAIVKQLTGIGIRRIAVFYQNDSYGQAGLSGVQLALKASDLEPVATGTVERNSTDVDAALKAIMPARPEAIVQISAYKSCATFIRRARQMGFVGNFYNVSFVGTQALMDELGAMAKGVVVSQVMPFPYSPVSPIASDFLAALKGRAGMQPNYSAMEGFVAARVFVEALRRAGNAPTRENFINAVQGMRDVQLGGFSVDYGPRKNTGSRFVELTLLTENGRVRR
jgi:branched-chain amino acid transport system substrate-binding protein